MTRIGRILAGVSVFLALSAPGTALSGDLAVTARVDKTRASLNDQITLTITVEGTVRSVPQPKLPVLEEFSVLSSGTSSNFRFVNGQMSFSKSFSYTLLPRETGRFTIGPAEIEFGSAVYSTEPIDIDVVESTAAAPPSALEERPSSGAVSRGEDVFITTSVDKKRAYVDEQVTLSFKFYTRVTLWEQPRYSAPDLTGFWVQDLPPQQEYYELVDGIRYRVVEIRTALFGTSPGTLTIGPASLSYVLRRNAFRMFSGRSDESVLRTDPIEVEIMKLPAAGRPEGFAGAIGNYEIGAALDVDSVEEFQPATLTITVKGTGNMKTVPTPVIPELREFRVYESSTSTEVKPRGVVVGGQKTYEYILVPQSPGEKVIPRVSLAFFDPAARIYKTAETTEMILTALPAAGDSLEPVARIIPTEISRIGEDIRHIRETEGQLRRASGPAYSSTGFLAVQVLPLLVLAGAWAGKRRRDRFAADSGLARYTKAPGKARKTLGSARDHLTRQEHTAACAACSKALTEFIGDRLDVSARGMTLPGLLDQLRSAGVDEELVSRVKSLLETCDRARFAQPGGQAEAERLLADASGCVKALERRLPRRR